MALDRAHLARIQAVLDALVATTPETPRAVPLAILAVEDAYVALSLGLGLGLPLARIRDQHAEVRHAQTEDPDMLE